MKESISWRKSNQSCMLMLLSGFSKVEAIDALNKGISVSVILTEVGLRENEMGRIRSSEDRHLF